MDLTASPVKGKPGWYVIDGIEVGPDYVFSQGKKLKGRPYLRALAYARAECLRTRGALVCELGEHYLASDSVTLHHRLGGSLHVARGLGIACLKHNSRHGIPDIHLSETERERLRGLTTTPSSSEKYDSARMRAKWLKWIRDSEGAFKEVDEMPLVELTRRAPRACANRDLGEETLGVQASYAKYVPMDQDDIGGPLHLFPKTNKQTGKLETWVRLSKADSDPSRSKRKEADETVSATTDRKDPQDMRESQGFGGNRA